MLEDVEDADGDGGDSGGPLYGWVSGPHVSHGGIPWPSMVTRRLLDSSGPRGRLESSVGNRPSAEHQGHDMNLSWSAQG